MLAMLDFQNPVLWAVVIAWIMSVVLHEFAHGIVAYWGGDYTIRERGGLTLNPLQYIDPFMSIILPVIFLAMGGIPLPGGSTFVRRDLLRSKAWSTAVSLAGPAMNFLIFLGFCVLLHPRVGWIDPHLAVVDWSTPQKFVGAMAFLQLFSVLLNLVPVPPLDGFQAISPYLPQEWVEQVTRPPTSTTILIGFFLVVSQYPPFYNGMTGCISQVLSALGVDPASTLDAFQEAFRETSRHQ
jgi:Zn-dependent protease